MKCKCGCNLFYINIIPCCDDCSENGAYDGEWNIIYDEKEIQEKGLTREQVEHDGECRMDTAFGAGCHMYICKDCNKRDNIPLLEGC